MPPRRSGTADLPRYGRTPRWLFERIMRLARAIAVVLVRRTAPVICLLSKPSISIRMPSCATCPQSAPWGSSSACNSRPTAKETMTWAVVWDAACPQQCPSRSCWRRGLDSADRGLPWPATPPSHAQLGPKTPRRWGVARLLLGRPAGPSQPCEGTPPVKSCSDVRSTVTPYGMIEVMPQEDIWQSAARQV